MYTYELLLEYLGLAVQNGISVSSFRAQKSQRWTLHRDMPIPSVAQLYYALKRFTELLKLDEMPEAQRCPHCQDEPDIILCDGTQATIRANQVRGNDCDRHVSAVTMSVHSTVEYVNRSSASCSYSFVQFSLMPIRDAKVREQLNRALEIKCADTDLLAHFSAPAREQSTYPVAEQIADYLLQYLQTWPNSADLLMFMRALAAGNTLYTALISDRAARVLLEHLNLEHDNVTPVTKDELEILHSGAQLLCPLLLRLALTFDRKLAVCIHFIATKARECFARSNPALRGNLKPAVSSHMRFPTLCFQRELREYTKVHY